MLRVFEHFGRRKVGMQDTSQKRFHNRQRDRWYGEEGRYETDGSRKRNDEKREANAEIAGEALQAVQTIVAALASPHGGRFTAVFSEDAYQGYADTNLTGRRIRITPKPLFDPTLKMVEACTILTGLAAHEVGHTWISEQTEGILNRKWPGSVTAKHVAMVLDDTRVNAFLRRRFPGVAFAIRPTAAYMAAQGGLADAPPIRYTPQLTVAQQLAFAVNAVLYTKHCRWVGDPLTREMRGRWLQWAADNASITEDHEVIAAIEAGIAMIHEPEPEQQPDDSPGEQEQDDEEPEIEEAEPEDFGAGDRDDDDDEDEPDESDEDEDGEDSDGEQGDEDEDSDDEPESDDPSEGSDPSDEDGEDDEPEDDEGNADEGDESEDGDEGDEPGESDADGEPNDDGPTDGEGNVPGEFDGDPDDEDDDVEDDGSEAESDDEGWDQDDEGDESESESEAGDDGEPGGTGEQDGGNDISTTIPEPDEGEEIKAPDQDAYNEDTSAEAMDLQERIEKQKAIERVAASDGFGTIKVNIV